MCFEKRQTLYIDSKGVERRQNDGGLADLKNVKYKTADRRARIGLERQKNLPVCGEEKACRCVLLRAWEDLDQTLENCVISYTRIRL